MESISLQKVSELIDYDSNTGLFYWKEKRRPNINPGDVAGCKSKANGYVEICVNGYLYKAHRLAWLIFTGSFPSLQIDHINGIRSDNRISNLREVSNTVNQQNQRLVRVDSKIGLKGITKNGKGFKASLRINGKRLNFGTFKTPEEAHQAYIQAKRKLHVGNTL